MTRITKKGKFRFDREYAGHDEIRAAMKSEIEKTLETNGKGADDFAPHQWWKKTGQKRQATHDAHVAVDLGQDETGQNKK